ncbi:phosphate ABC transporter permease subunit PstC [Aggregicoccus sp. 17bor-14]|nr:phosphate ABC transporter permease subunit PstC [Simulacricoccus sp. 17bor-14]MRI92099.1 phosphate ABC transporter permease subunit PstC [Aggregicoccus sp. 17bor-14]
MSRVRRRGRSNVGDRVWGALLATLGAAVLVIAGLIVFVLAEAAWPTISAIGLGAFLKGTDWDPVSEVFGALPFIYGTLVTSAIALVVALPVSIGLALFLTEMAPKWLRPGVNFAIETLASIPSVVYGLWALFVLVPWLRTTLEPALAKALGFLPLFQGAPLGVGYLAAGLVLAVMILPTISSITGEVMRTVPQNLKEGALALGATRWEAIRLAVLPYSRAGILGATLLGLGRALGETMAVTMVIGNSPDIRASLFAPGYSLPAVIANEFAEATAGLHTGALAALGLVLFALTLLLNTLARLLIRTVGGRAVGGAR